jgi:CRP/FNR family transcriptional regulator
MSAPIELLQQVPLFTSLSRQQLESLAQSFRDRTFSAGSEVTTEGQSGVGFFLIEDGTATVSVHGEERRTLGPGDYFGEMALIDDRPRSATIVADTDLRCWGLTSWEFRPLVESNASIAWALLQALAARLREQ